VNDDEVNFLDAGRVLVRYPDLDVVRAERPTDGSASPAGQRETVISFACAALIAETTMADI